MGTTKKTQQTAQYDPTSMGAFKQLTPAWSQAAQGFIQHPYSNPQFQFERQMGQQNANMQNQTNMNQLMNNFQMSGMGGGVMSPALQEMQNNQMRANTQNSAFQGFINPTQLANQRQQSSMGMAQGYRPLQTGQTQVESTGGLGTWLPQVAGLALGAATGGMGLIPGMAGGLGGALGGVMTGGRGWGGGFAGSGGGINPLMNQGQQAFNSPMGGGYGGNTYQNYSNQLTPPQFNPWE